MNCKPGDLARLVAPWIEEGRGRIVTVVRAATAQDWREAQRQCGNQFPMMGAPRDCWYCEGDIVLWSGPVRSFVIADSSLRPINPPAGTITDEEVRELFAPQRDEVCA